MSSFNLPSLFTTLTIICLINISKISQTSADGFSVNLIHRDSPFSPLYNPGESQYDRLRKAIARSVIRANRFSPTKVVGAAKDFQTDLEYADGEYIMKYSVGTPPFNVFSIADTGSDLIWSQCKPCDLCYKQNAPLFDPKSSSTYRVFSCQTDQCQELPLPSCRAGNVCSYSYSYGDSSFSDGDLAADTITFNSTSGRSVQFPKVTIGCGRSNGGTFSNKTSGIVGLGGGPLSLVSQLKSAISGKFSYCMAPLSKSDVITKINFGSNAVVSGSGAVSIPLVDKDPDAYYYVTLKGISVGTTMVPYKSSSSNNVNADVDEGNIIVDSGTVLTFLPSDMYSEVESVLDKAIGGKRSDSPIGFLKLCYNVEDGNELNIPIVTVHFDGGDVQLHPVNTFVRITDDLVCFTMVPASEGLVPIYGNLSQVNFLVGYDIVNKQVTFKPTDCTDQ
ncbi:Xylanase inhibitor, C-terminal [Dillenia turbinata]|uniref:Xylanase inhibitor, C-terminal n=1 Tax=Dillenia turbinata TaxID=194707 RepID=A0AAN8VJJ9_9MAGN